MLSDMELSILVVLEQRVEHILAVHHEALNDVEALLPASLGAQDDLAQRLELRAAHWSTPLGSLHPDALSRPTQWTLFTDDRPTSSLPHRAGERVSRQNMMLALAAVNGQLDGAMDAWISMSDALERATRLVKLSRHALRSAQRDLAIVGPEFKSSLGSSLSAVVDLLDLSQIRYDAFINYCSGDGDHTLVEKLLTDGEVDYSSSDDELEVDVPSSSLHKQAEAEAPLQESVVQRKRTRVRGRRVGRAGRSRGQLQLDVTASQTTCFTTTS
ncbi:hypothetical protein BKA62DRAFT_721083 [Auriculariales sp. MPI-PUGE-AT-0066]|nr:hypothetical protein BKA62DRAFT_721083 [Auriculariales sp. MPI-PUGE-AT-0066]